MCILFIAVEQHPDYPLIIAANRDEFHHRPTAMSSFWSDQPHVLAGKDLQAGGTWMGVNRQGYISALTNVRDPERIDPNATSRGELVSQYLAQPINNQAYLQNLIETSENYNGYNLLFGHWQDLWVYNNHSGKSNRLTPGFYGLSNADLNSPWPKINHGVAQLRQHCSQSGPLEIDALFSILLNNTQADDLLLPQTGVPIEWERKLSSIFIRSEEYGTRSSTLLMIDQQHNLSWYEHSFNGNGEITNQASFEFVLPSRI